MTEFIVTGILDYNPENVAFVRSIGLGDIPWLKPYPNSIAGTCDRHGGKIWIGPNLQEQQIAIRESGGKPLVLCLICAAVYAREVNGGSVPMISLSDKTTRIL
jgi:hypothetical protein